MGSQSNTTAVLLTGGKATEQTQGRRPGEDRDRDWCYAATSQGKPRIASNQQRLEEAKNGSPCKAFRESKALLTP